MTTTDNHVTNTTNQATTIQYKNEDSDVLHEDTGDNFNLVVGESDEADDSHTTVLDGNNVIITTSGNLGHEEIIMSQSNGGITSQQTEIISQLPDDVSLEAEHTIDGDNVHNTVVVSHSIVSLPIMCITQDATVVSQQANEGEDAVSQALEGNWRVIGDQAPMSCTTSVKQLDIGDTIKLLENVNRYPHISSPPVKPKAGEVYLFVPAYAEEQDNWKSDQYRWLNYGSKDIPKRDPLVKKLFFVGKNPEGKTSKFQRHVYTLIGDNRVPKPVLLHYIGDESVMIDHPHGNTKKSNDPYFATAPSVRKNISSKACTPNGTPNRVLQETNQELQNSADTTALLNPVLTPRNKIQVRNIRRNLKKASEKQRPSSTDMGTLYSLGMELPGFFHYMHTYPTLAVIAGLSDLALEVENLLKLNAGPLVFSYHETFKVGKYCVTAFNFVHAAFSDRPVIPLQFLITENTDDVVFYEKLLRTVADSVPLLDQLETAVVTSQDTNFSTPLNNVFPNFMQVYDWELVLLAARTWLRKTNQSVKTITERAEDLRVLLNSSTYEEFHNNLEKVKKQWDDNFVQYFNEYLLEIIRKRLGRWLLERYKLYHPQMGVIGARNLDLQVVVRHLQDLKEVTLDILLPSLYHLQLFLYANILKGFCGLGKYKVCAELSFLKREIDEISLPLKLYEPVEIVNILKVRGISVVLDEMAEEGEVESVVQAQRIVEMDNIVHAHQLQAFMVKSPAGSVHAVKLYPRESCTCSYSRRCCHIMAVMIAVGAPLFSEPAPLTNKHKKSTRKSRRAVPAKCDRVVESKTGSTSTAETTSVAETTTTTTVDASSLIDYEISQQTIVENGGVIPMMISTDGSETYVPVTVTVDPMRSEHMLTFQGS